MIFTWVKKTRDHLHKLQFFPKFLDQSLKFQENRNYRKCSCGTTGLRYYRSWTAVLPSCGTTGSRYYRPVTCGTTDCPDRTTNLNSFNSKSICGCFLKSNLILIIFASYSHILYWLYMPFWSHCDILIIQMVFFQVVAPLDHLWPWHENHIYLYKWYHLVLTSGILNWYHRTPSRCIF